MNFLEDRPRGRSRSRASSSRADIGPEEARGDPAAPDASGMVFQQFNLFPHMTAIGNVMEGPVT